MLFLLNTASTPIFDKKLLFTLYYKQDCVEDMSDQLDVISLSVMCVL